MLKRKKKNSKRGFTLIELIVVIAILGILAAILVPSMLGIVNDSRQAVADADARTLYSTAAAAYVKVVSDGVAPADITGTPTANTTFLAKVASDLGTGYTATYTITVTSGGVSSVTITEKNGSTATYPAASATPAAT